MAGGRVRPFGRSEEPYLRTRGMIVSPSVYQVPVCCKAPPRRLHGNPVAVSGSRHTRKINQSIRRCHPYATKSASRAFLSGMQLTLCATRPTPHGASRLAQAMSAWSVKTRRAPSRHCRNARVYGHATSAMHQNEYPPLRKLDNQRTVLLLFSGGRHGWRSS